jgi:hypothetical protein
MQVDLLAPQGDLSVCQQVRIAEVGAEHGIVILSGRTQQQGTRFLEEQCQLRQNACVAVVQAFGAARICADVAAVVEHGERVAVFERAGAALLHRGARRYIKLRYGRFVRRGIGGLQFIDEQR